MKIMVAQRFRQLVSFLHLSEGQGRLWEHPVKKWLLFGYGLTLGLLVIGGVLKYGFNMPTALSRIGAIIVALGVYLTWQDIRGRFAEADRRAEGFIRTSIATENQEFNPEPGRLRQRNFLTMEATIFALGTFTWGFGDLSLGYFVITLVLLSTCCLFFNHLLRFKTIKE